MDDIQNGREPTSQQRLCEDKTRREGKERGIGMRGEGIQQLFKCMQRTHSRIINLGKFDNVTLFRGLQILGPF